MQTRGRSAPILLVLIACFALAAAEPARGEPPTPDGELPPDVPRPEFLSRRPFIPDLLLRDKREGRYFTGIPALGWDAEDGFTVGGFINWFDNGSRDDPFFRTQPYRMKVFAGGVVTAEETLRLLGRLDWLNVEGSPYRLRFDGFFERSEIENYFGVGKDGIPLVSPRTGHRFSRQSSYQDDLNDFFVGPSGACIAGQKCTWSYYNKYQARDAIGVVTVERDTLGGVLRPLVGFQIRHVDVGDWSGKRVSRLEANGSGFQAGTRLDEDCRAGLVDRCGGGWDNLMKFGVTYDTRDFSPNPTKGVLAEGNLAVSSRWLGSSRSYQRLTLNAAVYHDFLADLDTDQLLIAAGRVLYNANFNGPPFYSLPKLGFNDFDRSGIGGFLTLRGYKNQRFQGDSALLLNGELRWFFTHWHLWGQDLMPGVALFGDVGRAYQGLDLGLSELQGAGGVGFRLAWNLATLISFDLGVSPEDTVFYMELGTSF